MPLWGGIGQGGYATVSFHENKKFNQNTWVKVVKAGHFRKAVQSACARDSRAPWKVLADNERFMKTAASVRAMKRAGITLRHIPPRSPDLNPVEKFWGWLKKQLRLRDLKDLKAGRAVPTKAAYRARVGEICRTKKARTVAKNFCFGLRKVCKNVIKNKGAVGK